MEPSIRSRLADLQNKFILAIDTQRNGWDCTAVGGQYGEMDRKLPSKHFSNSPRVKSLSKSVVLHSALLGSRSKGSRTVRDSKDNVGSRNKAATQIVLKIRRSIKLRAFKRSL